jgi:hypothetical protein
MSRGTLFAFVICTSWLWLSSGCGEDTGCQTAAECPAGQSCIQGFCSGTATDLGIPDSTIPPSDAKPPDTTHIVDNGTPDVPGLPDLTADLTPPTVVATTPANEESNVAIPFVITVTFSEPVKQGSFGSPSFIVKDAAGDQVSGTFSFNPDSTQAIFTPSSALLSSTAYEITLTTLIRDLAGNALADGYTFVFYTTGPANMDAYRVLAEQFAPHVYQEIDENNPQFDIPTSLNLDGDWNTVNNVAYVQSTATQLSPAVHWSVVESQSHYFIQYFYYWPLGDAENSTTQDIPNDSSGAMVVVRKGNFQPELVITFFSISSTKAEFFAFAPENNAYGDIQGTYPENEWLVGTTYRPFQSFIPAHTHHSCLWDNDGIGQFCTLNQSVRDNMNLLTLVPSVTAGGPGVVLKQGADWSIPTADIGYTMVSILDSWWPRRLVQPNSLLWNTDFQYSNPPAGRPGAGMTLPSQFYKSLEQSDYAGRPAWAWKWSSGMGLGEQQDLPRGLSFLDPAWFVAWRHLSNSAVSAVSDTWNSSTGEGFSLEYCFNPFVQIDNRNTPACMGQ